MKLITDQLQLLEALRQETLVITPNNRLSNELIKDYFNQNTASVQVKPRCFPYTNFLTWLFKTNESNSPHDSHPILLTTYQLHFLWKQVCSHYLPDSPNEGLLSAIEEAWRRCLLWQVDFHHSSFNATPQTRLFQQLAFQMDDELASRHSIAYEQIVPYLLNQKKHQEPGRIIWACFDDFTPQQQCLQDALRQQGWEHYAYDHEITEANAYHYKAKNEQDEQEQLIQWILHCLSQGKQRIGIVVPNLPEQYTSIQRLFQRQIPVPFNFSLGKSLIEYPLVAHALSWLQLDRELFTIQDIQQLLHSPYLKDSQQEFLARSQFMENNKLLQETSIPHLSLVKALFTQGAPSLANLLTNLTSYPKTASVHEWINEFITRLNNLGFPGDYSLNSENYQCYQRFLAIFDEFKQLHLITPQLSKKEALAALKYLAQTTIFQPKCPASKVHILGLLEASGCSFDSLWITGLTDRTLPQKINYSAFIPIILQQNHHMPYSNLDREFLLAEKILLRLQSSCAQSVFSYPGLEKDQPNMPCSLITRLPFFQPYTIDNASPSSPLVSWSDHYQLPVHETEHIVGGTLILTNQAKCAFRAFAKHRLAVAAPPDLSEGPNALERGQLIHKSLELLWKKLGQQKTLLTINLKQLDDYIEEAIQQALKPIIKQRPESFSKLIQEVEYKRLQRLIHASLAWERQRPEFTIEVLEEAFNLRLGRLDFSIRVDRIDRVGDNKWIIDYKTTLPTQPWKEDRPQEPQLLLYALLDTSINALLFAQLKKGQFVCRGFSEEDYSELGMTRLKQGETWSNYRKFWETQLTMLAEEFSAGHCVPNPRSSSICQQCDYQHLCRKEIS